MIFMEVLINIMWESWQFSCGGWESSSDISQE